MNQNEICDHSSRRESKSHVPANNIFQKFFYSKKVWLCLGALILLYLLKRLRKADKKQFIIIHSQSAPTPDNQGLKASLYAGFNNLRYFLSNGISYGSEGLKSLDSVGRRLFPDLGHLKQSVADGLHYVKEQTTPVLSNTLSHLSSKLPCGDDLNNLKDGVTNGMGYLKEKSGQVVSDTLSEINNKLPSGENLKNVASDGVGFVKEKAQPIFSEVLPNITSKIPSTSDLNGLKNVVASGVGYVKEKSEPIISKALPSEGVKLPSWNDLKNLKDFAWKGWRKN